jgi:hypothetical protein
MTKDLSIYTVLTPPRSEIVRTDTGFGYSHEFQIMLMGDSLILLSPTLYASPFQGCLPCGPQIPVTGAKPTAL